MAFKKYMKIAGMSVAGFALVFIGLYMIIFASSGPTGFGLMMGGLLLTMIGGIYGKKKLMEGDSGQQSSVDSRQIDQIKQNVVSQLRPSQKEADPPEEMPDPPGEPEQKPLPKQAAKAEAKIQPETAQEPKPIIRMVQAPSAEGTKPKLVKVMVCPSCDTENPPTNMYCSKCGKRLRAQPLEKPKPRKKAAKKRAKKRA